MASSFIRVGLTGGIATGKSFCLQRFAELGAPTLDADVLSRNVIAPGTPGFGAVVQRFGRGIIDTSGAINRPALGRIVFADAEARQALEQIIHPAVYAATVRWFKEQEAAGARVAVADIPLLFETGRLERFDRTVVAYCPAATQKDRLMARNGLSDVEAQQRIDAQLPIEQKRLLADYAIDTSGTFDHTRREVDRVWAALNALAVP